MDDRRTLLVAGFVRASLSYVFNLLAFTGAFDVFRWVVFAALSLGFTYGFDRFIGWQTGPA
ncbi:hypothetical protein [Halorubrum ezzemoulense]|uniref:hypothetical protein n=1 Tax=Halorubrum ezzemoulense TaxID=337243 RepID=UPI003D7ED28D